MIHRETDVYRGYGILDKDDVLVWSATPLNPRNRSLVFLVRGRDYPGYRVVMWVQSAKGGPTVHQEIKS